MDINDTREQIVDSGADLMWRRGYSRTSVDDIIRDAGVCKGSFYHYFTSKEALGLAVIGRWTAHFGERIQAHLSPQRAPEENLHAILDAFVATQEESGYLGCPLGRLALEMGDASEDLRAAVEAGFDGLRELFTQHLSAAGMSEDVAREQGSYMLATLEGALMLEKVRGGGEVLHSLVATMKTDVSRRLVELAA